MRTTFVDPGYGDPNAPVGSPEWAKRWRLEFQTSVKDLSRSPKLNAEFYEDGKRYRAWTLVTDDRGRHFKTWEAFCAYPQPWGLGTDPAEFKAFLDAVEGKRAADLETVSPAEMGRPHKEGEGKVFAERTDSGRPSGFVKQAKLRAILRAPEVIQDLYRQGLITQTVAAKLGPKSPSPERAAAIAEARQAIEQLDRSQPPAKFRAEAKRLAALHLGGGPSTLDRLRKLWAKATPLEREEFIDWTNRKET